MAQFRIDHLANLARQLSFTPTDARAQQVDAAEALLLEIDPAKAYPLELIVFRVTGYRPKAVVGDLLTGLALQHDLGLLVEQVSETLGQRSDAFHQPVLMIDEVCERFNVTSKTIQRWRRKGLAARRFVFPDGKRRVGFMLASVERFLAAHADHVSRAANFSQVDDAERDLIVRQARRLASRCQCCGSEIARRLGRRLNRSHLTIAHVIRRHDELNPADAVFPLIPPEIAEGDRTQIVRAYRRGLAIGNLAKRMCRPRSAIYRVILEERLARLSKRKVKFIDDPLYHAPDAEAQLTAMVNAEVLAGPPRIEERRVPSDIPAPFQELYRTPLLTPARERALFLKFNYHKFRFVTARRALDPQLVRSRDVNVLEGHRAKAVETKNQILRANLRLVVSIARKHLRPSLSLMELVSEGNLTLMRAVESFDAHKGFRFSTYATLALMKGFARTVPEMIAAAGRSLPAGRGLDEVVDSRVGGHGDRLLHRDEVGVLLARLEPFERDVLRSYYGLDESGPAASYEEVGQRLGLSKQRVRQIERVAMDKLRLSVSAAAAAI